MMDSTTPHCRACDAPLVTTFVDLGVQPLSNSYVSLERKREPDIFYPLHVYVCDRCFLVQLESFESREAIFSADYAYYSSFADSWIAHAKAYVAHATQKLGLTRASRIVEIASNDGYLLRWFVERGMPVMGIEPAAGVAAVAVAAGVPTRVEFFGVDSARRLRAEFGPADLMAANNVLAHVPDLHDFVGGFAIALAETGTATFEFPHVMRLIEDAEFDTIYHEHFSYISLLAIEPVFAKHGLVVHDLEELPTHGGSLRLWVRHAGVEPTPAVRAMRERERAAGLGTRESYTKFGERVAKIKRDTLRFLIDAAERGERVVGYGAPAKGNTFLNYCGVGPDLLAFTCDRNPQKHGKLLPGSRIPIMPPEAIDAERPAFVLILPWNIEAEVTEQLKSIRTWGGRFVVAIPHLRIS